MTVTAATPKIQGDRVSIWRQSDPILIFTTLAIASLGVLMVFSATRGPGLGGEPPRTAFLERQTLFAVAGAGLMVLVMAVDFRRIREVVPLLYVALLAVLALVLVVGVEVNGARAWFRFGSFTLQPAEFGKLAIVVTLAAVLGGGQGSLPLRKVALALAIVGLPAMLIMRQPDLGTLLVYGAILAAVLFVAGIRTRHLLGLMLVLTLCGFGAVQTGVLDDYQLNRLTAFVDKKPNEQNLGVFQHQSNAQVAVGNGGLFGKGIFNGTQNRSSSVPEQQTDFIFTVVGEELGFAGSLLLISLFGLLVWRILRIAALAHEFSGMLICVGVLAMFVFQVFEVVGMTMGIMPITGIPLPFVSYGGSSVLTSFAAVGLVQSVHMRRFT